MRLPFITTDDHEVMAEVTSWNGRVAWLSFDHPANGPTVCQTAIYSDHYRRHLDREFGRP